MTNEPKGYVNWADGPPPDGAEGAWLVDGPLNWLVAIWHGGHWISTRADYDPGEITRHARLE